MIKKERRSEFFDNPSKVAYIKKILDEGTLHEYMDVILTYMNPYSPEIIAPQEWLQIRYDGGVSAISKWLHVFNTLIDKGNNIPSGDDNDDVPPNKPAYRY